ncbi:MAG: hypothetical protein KKF12_06550 [Proteobacteria bacterium]|nr:hypothetical protein [Desulfobacula sp.]MBU3953788.1 hypothetical protein [Pseudomonadota bacterium]MBU4130460.1 hypothetical protein [Pseudomonadota bacterium]
MEFSSIPADTGKIQKLYRLYEKTMAGTQLMCREGCAGCCTCNVIVTGLETAFLVQSLDSEALAGVKKRLGKNFPAKRYIPKMTTNQFAEVCLSGQDIPEEENNPEWGKCPLLEDDRCTLYPVRPFGCRSMMSQTDCLKTGYAQVPPLVLTITNIFVQTIEHLDHQGISGNLSDMLVHYLGLEKYQDSDKTNLFTKNSKIQALMVPPEHRLKVASLLKQIAALTQGV